MLSQELPSTRQFIASVSAGLVLGFIRVVVAVSFASLIFTGVLQPYLPQGIAIVLFTAIISSLVISLLSPPLGFIGILQDNPSIIMAIGIGSIAATTASDALFPTVMGFIVLTTLLTGVVMFGMGQFKLGGFVRYIPYPVIAGFMAGTGWLLVRGAINTMATAPVQLDALNLLLAPEQLMLWLPGVVFGLLLFLAVKYIDNFLTMPLMIILSLAGFYVLLSAIGVSVPEAADMGLIIGEIEGTAIWNLNIPAAALQANWQTVFGELDNTGTLILLAGIQILLNISAMELVFKTNIDFNRELRTIGVLNLVSGLGGGMVGFHSLSSTTLSYRIGGRGRLPGLVVALVCLLMLLFGTNVLQYIPKFVLGGLLIFLGLGFLNKWIFQGWRKFNTADYSAVLIILLVIATIGFLQGIGVGLILTIIIFVYSYSQTDIFHHMLNGTQTKSNVKRNAYHERKLVELGERIYILELKGFLFFGTASTVLQQIEERLADTSRPPLRFLILDFRRINGFDSSTGLILTKIQYLAEAQGFSLVFTDISSDLDDEIEMSDVVIGDRVKIFPDLDRGLEWCETMLLDQEAVTRVNTPTTLRRQLENLGFSAEHTDALRPYLEPVRLQPGDVLIRQGAQSSELYFIEIGQVSIYLDLPDGRHVRAQTYNMGTVVGEIGFYLDVPRSASVIADARTIAYKLSKKQVAVMEHRNPQLALAFKSLIIRVIAERLIISDRTLAALSH